jgi:hypothetical protein
MLNKILLSSVLLRDQLLRQMPFAGQAWVKQQAEEIARSGRFTQLEEMRLDNAIRLRVSRSPSLAGAELPIANSMLKFLILMRARELSSVQGHETGFQNLGQKAGLQNLDQKTDFQDFDQKTNQLFNILSTVVKSMKDEGTTIARKLS